MPELWLAPNDDMRERYAELKDWICRLHHSGCTIYSACSGSVMLAATGLLKGREATSHWAYADLFRKAFPTSGLIQSQTLYSLIQPDAS